MSKLIFHYILASLYFLNSHIWHLNLSLSNAILISDLFFSHTLIYIFVFTISVAHFLLCILLKYIFIRKFLLLANWYLLIILNWAFIVVSILITPVLTLIQKTSYISTIDWSMVAFHFYLLLLLLRLIWISFVFVHIPYFGNWVFSISILFSFFIDFNFFLSFLFLLPFLSAFLFFFFNLWPESFFFSFWLDYSYSFNIFSELFN